MPRRKLSGMEDFATSSLQAFYQSCPVPEQPILILGFSLLLLLLINK